MTRSRRRHWMGSGVRQRLTSKVLKLILGGPVIGLFACGLVACEGSLSPFCVAAAATQADVMAKVRYHCPLTPDEQRAFDAEIGARQRAEQAQHEHAGKPTTRPCARRD
jgi:hypothetical protein